MSQVLAAPDKFRGTATAAEAARAMAAGARRAGWDATRCPLADGGEGTLDAFGGPNRRTRVTGPLGAPVEAAWRLDESRAIIEMALASGLALVGGRARNDPLRATTYGTGELITHAARAGATHIIVGVGGSATTDGGAGAIEALGGQCFADLGVMVEIACDVEIRFLDAPRVFGPQKGAGITEIAELERRLGAFSESLRSRYGLAVTELPFGGAAGGLAGGLAALGAHLRSGFSLIADAVGFDRFLDRADLVITGEGALDATSFRGKVVGGVLERTAARELPNLVIAGRVAPDLRSDATISLVDRFGVHAAHEWTTVCIEEAVFESLARR